MKEKTFRENTEICDVINYLQNINISTIVIFSPTSMKLNKLKVENKNLIWIDVHHFKKDINLIYNFFSNKRDCVQVITFGGGSVIDVGKYISSLMNLKHICIPSMLSTNVYSTDKVSLIRNKDKITLPAKIPDLILLDNNILKNSQRQNLYGLVDIFSIHTALKDWEIANQFADEVIDKKIYEMSKNLLNKTINFVENNNLDNLLTDIEKMYDLIGQAGHITNVYSTGRPESGSEHIFTKTLETLVEDVPHGVAVSLGILIMSLIQDNYSNQICNCLKKIGVLKEIERYGLNNDITKNILLKIVPRLDRYSIIDRIVLNDNTIDDIILKLNTKIGGCEDVVCK